MRKGPTTAAAAAAAAAAAVAMSPTTSGGTSFSLLRGTASREAWERGREWRLTSFRAAETFHGQPSVHERFVRDLQQHTHHVRVALFTRNEKWRAAIIPCLVHVDALLVQQHRHYLRVALFTRNKKWRVTSEKWEGPGEGTIIHGPVHVDTNTLVPKNGGHSAGVAVAACGPESLLFHGWVDDRH